MTLKVLGRTSKLDPEQVTARVNGAVVRLIPRLQRIPRPLVPPIGSLMGTLAFLLWRRVREIALQNLSRAFPEMPRAEAQRLTLATFRNWGTFVLQSLKLPAMTDEDWKKLVIVEGAEHFYRARDRGKGIILVSGHFGCFEMGASYASYEGVKTSVIVRYAKSSEVTEKINALRESAGYQVLCYDARGFRAMKKLRNNETVCILVDQDAGRSGIFVRFFGQPASAPPGPAILAARTGATLLPAFVIREKGGRFRMMIQPEVPSPGPEATEAEIQTTMQAVTDRLEAVVRQYPDQWLWMHRRWKTRPSDLETEQG